MKIPVFEAVKELVGGQITGGNDLSEYQFHDGQTPPTQAEVDAKIKEQENEYEKQAYARSRQEEYPSYADQFDTIYHQGIDAWKAEIKKVKDANPKPSE
tara:strand:- start:17 stop:313 length:297 start_codon:yes stop_codon:yes gene_type:complete